MVADSKLIRNTPPPPPPLLLICSKRLDLNGAQGKISNCGQIEKATITFKVDLQHVSDLVKLVHCLSGIKGPETKQYMFFSIGSCQHLQSGFAPKQTCRDLRTTKKTRKSQVSAIVMSASYRFGIITPGPASLYHDYLSAQGRSYKGQSKDIFSNGKTLFLRHMLHKLLSALVQTIVECSFEGS
jgi:hypothetical protein